MIPRAYAFLAELTHRCPLRCPYCSNPTDYPKGRELTTAEWCRVMGEAARLGVLQAGFSGGEPLLRRDLATIIAAARANGLYTNLLTSGLGLDQSRAFELRDAGLDSLQISFQSDAPELADVIAGVRAHSRKLIAARIIRETGIALSMNVVLHRTNIDRLTEIISFAELLGAERLELANVQYYGWAQLNRAHLLPTREQVGRALQIAQAEKQRLAGKLDLFYVLPDYYEQRPKPCMQGWGRRYITVNPVGEVLPCPTASMIPGLRFDNVRERTLQGIWSNSESFNRFRGTEWMPEPCQSCPQREVDFGGCRCQAALLTGDASAVDPVCGFSPERSRIDRLLNEVSSSDTKLPTWVLRQNP